MARRTADLRSLKLALDAIGIHHGTPDSRAAGLVVRDLCDAETLPVEGIDVFSVLPLKEGQPIPIAAYGRCSTTRRDSWVWYFANGSVQIIAVTRGL